MSSSPKTWVVIPCYNEAKRLQIAAFLRFATHHSNVGFLFVDDGSRDKTITLLEKMHDAIPEQLYFLSLPKNVGKAEAVRQGVLHLLENSGPDFIGYWDADLATPLSVIPKFVSTLEHQSALTLVLGARVALLGRHVERHWLRHVMGRGFATLASSILKLPVYDTQCGAKMFRVTPALKAIFATPFIANWIFDVEILARMLSKQSTESRRAIYHFLYESPLPAWSDVAGSKLKWFDGLKAAKELTQIYWHYFSPFAKFTPIPKSSYQPIPATIISETISETIPIGKNKKSQAA